MPPLKSKKKKTPRVTVYIVCHNYGRFLSQAIESVINQSFKDWELLIYDDGSTDQTAQVASRFLIYPNISFFQQKRQGLIPTANQAIDAANGEFIMRLDADDYLDENTLLILVQTFIKEPDLALVYPDYYVINEENIILEHIRRNTLTQETTVLDLPAHGACSLIKRSVILGINKYDKENLCQDGYDLWLKLMDGHRVKNVNLPLFYYRFHGQNLTVQEHKILNARQKIKEQFVRKKFRPEKFPEVLAIIPTRATKTSEYANPFRELAGRPLIDYTLHAAQNADLLSRRIVLSEDGDVLDYVKKQNFETLQRPVHLGGLTSRIEETILWVLKELKTKENYVPELVMILYINSVLRKASHIDEAVYSQMIFKTDSVISVTQNNKFLYRHEGSGLVPLYKKRLLRHEKDMLYEENGAIELSRTEIISEANFLGKTIGHVLMSPKDSVRITGDFDFWIIEQILKSNLEGLNPIKKEAAVEIS